MATLKSDDNKLDIDKLEKLDVDKLVPVPTDLSKLSNVLKNGVVEKTEYNAKTKYIEDKIHSITN